MTDSDIPYTAIVRDGVARATKDFTLRVERLGFKRTKKMFWTRCKPHRVEFIHLHRSGSSYGAPGSASVAFRVHLGIRVLNDRFEAAALNGPDSEKFRSPNVPYHLRFNAKTGSTYERCTEDLIRFICEIGVPWFDRFSSPDNLVKRPDSPLSKEAKECLVAAVRGEVNPESVIGSAKLLGLQKQHLTT